MPLHTVSAWSSEPLSSFPTVFYLSTSAKKKNLLAHRTRLSRDPRTPIACFNLDFSMWWPDGLWRLQTHTDSTQKPHWKVFPDRFYLAKVSGKPLIGSFWIGYPTPPAHIAIHSLCQRLLNHTEYIIHRREGYLIKKKSGILKTGTNNKYIL